MGLGAQRSSVTALQLIGLKDQDSGFKRVLAVVWAMFRACRMDVLGQWLRKRVEGERVRVWA